VRAWLGSGKTGVTIFPRPSIRTPLRYMSLRGGVLIFRIIQAPRPAAVESAGRDLP